MKNLKLIMLLAFLLPVFIGYSQHAEKSESIKPKQVEVYYFHFARRCATCLAVEAESKKAVETIYPEQVKAGIITFASLDIGDDASASAIQKAKAEGQSLLVISGDKRIDLTDKAFMYARNNPEKLKEEIKKTIDSIIYSK